MSVTLTVTRDRIQRLLDERTLTNRKHEGLLEQAEARARNGDAADGNLTEIEQEQIRGYHERTAAIDTEVRELHEQLEREESSAQTSDAVRRHLTGNVPGQVSTIGGDTVYRTFSAYARDQLITRYPEIAELAGGEQARIAARERLNRAPQHTLTSDLEGLVEPAQHLAQIMDVIDTSRPVVATANRVNLVRGKLTYPIISARPTVLYQGTTEKTEGGTAKMQITMGEGTADTFIGGGNLSWQAVQWSTPDALEMWFRLAGEAYAIQTEGTACGVLMDAGTATISDNITGGTADTFADVILAISEGAGAVFANSRAMPDTLYVSPDVFFNIAGLTTDAGAPFITAGQLNLSGRGGNLAGLNVVASAGFGTNVAIIGDSSAFLCAETGGAPVRLQVVEPAIGGYEVGVIGAFKAVAFDSLRFATLI